MWMIHVDGVCGLCGGSQEVHGMGRQIHALTHMYAWEGGGTYAWEGETDAWEDETNVSIQVMYSHVNIM